MTGKGTARPQKTQEAVELLKQAFPPIHYDDIFNFKPDPNNHIAGDGFLRKGAGTLLIGGTGIGKSVLSTQIGISVATGLPFFGIPVRKPRKVLYIESQNDLENLHRDILSIATNLKVDVKVLQKNFSVRFVPGIPTDLFEDWFDDIVAEEQADLVILDPYQSFVGEVDINRSESFLKWVGPVDAVLHMRSCGLLLVAHTPKPVERNEWTTRDMVYLAAGTSVISNWARASCELMSLKTDPLKFQLHFAKNAERTGLLDGKSVVRRVLIEHSGDVKKPFWKLSPEQTMMKTDAKGLIEKTHVAHPEWTQAEIAENLCLDRSTVCRYFKKGKKK